jgi:hypothetical protein
MQMTATSWLDTPCSDDHVPVEHNNAAKSAKMEAYVESCVARLIPARRVKEKL